MKKADIGTWIMAVVVAFGWMFLVYHAYGAFAYENPPDEAAPKSTVDLLQDELDRMSDDAVYLMEGPDPIMGVTPEGVEIRVINLYMADQPVLTVLDGVSRRRLLDALSLSERVWEGLDAKNAVSGKIDPFLLNVWRESLNQAWRVL